MSLQSCKVNNPKKIVYDTLDLREGYQLNYKLAYGDERYQFIVDMLELEPYRTFKFTMTNKGRTSAIISISQEALKSATDEKNQFGGRNDTLENYEITIWFSEKMFDDLVSSDTAYFVPDASLFGKSQNVAFYNAGLAEYRYERNGKPQVIEVMKVLEKDGDRSFLVLNDRSNPLIIKMDIDWVIWLKEVNHVWQN